MAEEDMVEVGLTDATHQQLLWFAKIQNYACSENDSQNQLYSMIKSAYNHPSITVPRVIENDVSDKPNPVINSPGLPPRVKLKILSVGDDAKTEEYIAHEGRAYRIQVGHIVELPADVFQSCILDAIEQRFRSEGDSGLGEVMNVQAINFTRIE